jgi:hypothetical protein
MAKVLLRVHDPGSRGARNPHILPCMLRFLRSVLPRLKPAHDAF